MKQNSKLILDFVEKYGRRWVKKEDVEAYTLSEWVKTVMFLVNRKVSVLNRTMSRRHESVFDNPDVAAELAITHEKFVVVPADKASNNIVFVCKTHYIIMYRVFIYLKHHVYYVSINSFIYYVSKNNFLEQHVYNNMLL